MQDTFYNPYLGVYKRAVELYQEHNYNEAFQKFFLVVEKDEDNFEACFYLAECYFYGFGIDKNLEQAFQLYLKAASKKYLEAVYMTGYCYEMGFGVDRDETQAITWYMQAAKQDHEMASYRLGLCYKKGIGIQINYSLAAAWLLKAAKKGNVEAQKEGAMCYELLNQPKAAATLYLSGAIQKDPFCEEKIADCYADGIGCPQSSNLAKHYFLLSIEHGNDSASLNLADRYAIGRGMPKSMKEAVYWWTKIASTKPEAQMALAKCYLNGIEVNLDIDQGLRLLRSAADSNNIEALVSLAKLNTNPLEGYEQDLVVAKHLWSRAATLGNVEAQYELGKCYEKGVGMMKPNYIEAYKWYRLSSRNGNELATKACARFKKSLFGRVKIKGKLK